MNKKKKADPLDKKKIEEPEVKKSVANIVKSWLPDDDESEEVIPVEAPRPSRLGIGAKFIPHNQVADKLQITLKKKIKNKQNADKEDFEQKVEMGGSEDESRSAIGNAKKRKTVIIESKKKTKKTNAQKKAKTQQESEKQDVAPTQKEEPPNSIPKPDSMELAVETTNQAVHPDNTPTPTETETPTATQTATYGPAKQKKKKKTRSWQKNIKKDKRPNELKPEHLRGPPKTNTN